LSDVIDARVDLGVENTRAAGDRQVAQLTLRTDRGTILRAEERTADMFAAIDAVMEKITRQIERYKGRGKERTRQRRRSAAAADNGASEAVAEVVETSLVIRHKRFKLTPMTENDAVEQMELLGHPFYVFFNSEDKSIQVLYRREDSTYGVLMPEVD
jgi:putative sigma-54 modulation protein